MGKSCIQTISKKLIYGDSISDIDFYDSKDNGYYTTYAGRWDHHCDVVYIAVCTRVYRG